MKNFSQRNRSKIISGFTMVELLVLIAIISILMAMLLPALKKARGMAKQMECLNTMKQCGTASVYYLGDFGHLPPIFWTDSLGDRFFYWDRALISLGYLPPKSTKVPIWANRIGQTGCDTGRPRQYTCPEVPETVEGLVTRPYSSPDEVIGTNAFIRNSPGLLHGPSFKYPSRLFYIGDSYSYVPP